MTAESKNNPQPTSCTHPVFSKVAGTEGSDGSYDAICTRCSESRRVHPPKTEATKDKRPMLLE